MRRDTCSTEAIYRPVTSISAVLRHKPVVR
jgi:hypothetical protein